MTPERRNHIAGVAERARELAKKLRPDDTAFAEEMFVLGWLHDVGYALDTKERHAAAGAAVLKRCGYAYWREIADHGRYDVGTVSDALFVLDCADMTVDGYGRPCTTDGRINDIADRYGKDSAAHAKALRVREFLRADPRFSRLFPEEYR